MQHNFLILKTALYTRVSTKKQNTDRQVTELQAYAQKQGFEVVLTICETVSGSSKNVYNFFTDKAHREELSKVFHAPLLNTPSAV